MTKEFNVEGISCNELALECRDGDFIVKCRNRYIAEDGCSCYHECDNMFLFYDPLHAEGYVCEHAMEITANGLPLCCVNDFNSEVDNYFGNYEYIMHEQIETVVPIVGVNAHIKFHKWFDKTATHPEKEVYSICPDECSMGHSCVTFEFTRLHDRIISEHSLVSICPGTSHSLGFESIACCEMHRILDALK